MKKALLFLLTATSFSAYAQGPTLISSSAPQAGDVFITQPVDVTSFTPGSGGSGQTWDYSAIRDSGISTTSYVVNPATTPYANLYPGATIAFYTTSGTDTAYVYDQVSSSRYTFLGNYYDLVGGVYYDPARVIFEYPLSYGGAYAHTFGGSTDNGDTITGVDSFTADGYGTLRLPYGTFSDVLRVKYVIHSHSVNSGAGFFENIDQVQYSYYTLGYHSSLFDIQYTTNNINGVVISATTAQYAKGVSTGIHDMTDASQFSVYPNPSNGSFTISSDMVSGGDVTITDLTGTILWQEKLTADQQRVSVSPPAKGIYLVTIKNDKGTVTKKLIVE